MNAKPLDAKPLDEQSYTELCATARERACDLGEWCASYATNPGVTNTRSLAMAMRDLSAAMARKERIEKQTGGGGYVG